MPNRCTRIPLLRNPNGSIGIKIDIHITMYISPVGPYGNIMKLNRQRVITLAMGLTVASFANAVTFSSFLNVTSNDITFVPTNGGLTIDVILGANPTFTYLSTTYQIASVVGFYALSSNSNFVVSNSNFIGTNGGTWTTNNNNGGTNGSIAGWKTNPNTGFNVNQNQSFTFNSLNVAVQDSVGLHIRLKNNPDGSPNNIFPLADGTSSGGNTGNIRLVPEPASLATLGLGVIGLISRRRKK